MDLLTKYLIAVNIVGFLLFGLNTLMYLFDTDIKADALLTFVAFIGGSAGIILAILIMDRRAEKGNMMSRVFVFAIFFIQIIIVLFLRGHHAEKITLNFIKFFNEHRILIVYLIVVNIITFIMFTIDKYNAIIDEFRIRNVTLLIMCFLGGSVGGILSMYLFRHKTSKDYYVVGVPLIILMQVVVIFYIMNMK